MRKSLNRRTFIKIAAGLSLAGNLPTAVRAQQRLPERGVPGTGERLPVIGLGSTKAVLAIPQAGTEPLYQVLQMLMDAGGKVVDTAPRPEAIDRDFGQVLQDPRWRDRLFVSTKINAAGKQAGQEQMQQTRRLFGMTVIDLVQVESMTDIATHWPTLRAWKDQGVARYIGATVATVNQHEQMESFMKTDKPDFIQVNYSVAEPQASERLLPLAADLGIAVQINRPFMNGEYFQKTRGRVLPAWAVEFECASWAQFSLKYILAHPAVTCVLTETTTVDHLRDNLQAAYGRLPDANMQAQMRSLIEAM